MCHLEEEHVACILHLKCNANGPGSFSVYIRGELEVKISLVLNKCIGSHCCSTEIWCQDRRCLAERFFNSQSVLGYRTKVPVARTCQRSLVKLRIIELGATKVLCGQAVTVSLLDVGLPPEWFKSIPTVRGESTTSKTSANSIACIPLKCHSSVADWSARLCRV